LGTPSLFSFAIGVGQKKAEAQKEQDQGKRAAVLGLTYHWLLHGNLFSSEIGLFATRLTKILKKAFM
jgi:hypothetical protein